jgi:hypothetical protein
MFQFNDKVFVSYLLTTVILSVLARLANFSGTRTLVFLVPFLYEYHENNDMLSIG